MTASNPFINRSISSMEITERDSARVGFWRPDILNKLLFFLGAIIFIVAIGAALQIFARYQYVVEHGIVWRIDRLTQQTCRVGNGHVFCGPPPKSISVSTSVSPSLSTSAAVVHPR